MAAARIYLASIETYSGKSAVGLGLASHYKDSGINVGYMKPVGNVPITIDHTQTDEDAFLVSEAIGNPAPLSAVAPIVLTSQVAEDAFNAVNDPGHYPSVITQAYEKVAEGRDLVLIEGAADLNQGGILGASLPEVSHLLDAPVILVVRSSDPLIADRILGAKKVLGDNLFGVVFVSLPPNIIEKFAESVRPYLESQDIKVLGLLPEERSLMSVTIGELVEALAGEILCLPEKSEELVESYLVGAMGQERALRFFRRKVDKAVITGGDRSDIQLAALETQTKCLILTGNLYPSSAVIARAEEKGVPIILAPQDTFNVVQIVESITGRIGFHQPRKVKQMRKLLDEHFDFDKLNQRLGLVK